MSIISDFIGTIKLWPFYSIAVIFFVILISLFFALSKRKELKIFMIFLSAASIIVALFLNIFTFLKSGIYTSFLFSFGFLEAIEISIMLFSVLNLLIFISIYNFEKNHFIKLLIMLLFTASLVCFLALSNNFIMTFVSFGIFTAVIFQLVSSLNNDILMIKNDLIRFFLTAAVSLIIIFAGFSFIYGTANLNDFKQVMESDNISSALVAIGIFLISIGIYFYLFIFPFQNTYLKTIKKSEHSTPVIVWFLYIPAGFFLFFKMNNLLFYFITKNQPYLSIAFIAAAMVCILGGNVGAIKTTSLRRIFAFLFMAIIGFSILSYAMFGLGLIAKNRVAWLSVFNLILLMMTYFPVYGIIADIEKRSNTDAFNNLKGLSIKNKYLGINLTIILISFCGMIGTFGYLTKFYYFESFIRYLKGEINISSGLANLILLFLILAVVIIGTVFILANVIRIIIQLFKSRENPEDYEMRIHESEVMQPELQSKKVQKNNFTFARFYYFYVTIYTVIIIIVGIFGILEIFNAGISFIPFKFTTF